MNKPNLTLIANWITALRSGKYQQGKRALKRISANGTFLYCCLGVACEVAGAVSAPRKIHMDSTDLHSFEDYLDFPPPSVYEAFQCDIKNIYLRYSESTRVTPAQANDSFNMTFLEIADAIERYFNLSPYKS